MCIVVTLHRDIVTRFVFLLIFKINKKKDEFCNLQKLVILLVLSFKFGAGAISGYRRIGKVKISLHNSVRPWIYSTCCSCILYFFWIKNRFIFMSFCLRMSPKSCIFAIHFTITLMQCNWLGNNQKHTFELWWQCSQYFSHSVYQCFYSLLSSIVLYRHLEVVLPSVFYLCFLQQIRLALLPLQPSIRDKVFFSKQAVQCSCPLSTVVLFDISECLRLRRNYGNWFKD